jgi:hypothetical protein
VAAPGLELHVPQPVQDHRADVARVWDSQANAIRLGVARPNNVTGPDRGERGGKDGAEFGAAVVRKDHPGGRDLVGEGHACSQTAALKAAANDSRLRTDSSPSASRLTRTRVSSPVMPPV